MKNIEEGDLPRIFRFLLPKIPSLLLSGIRYLFSKESDRLVSRIQAVCIVVAIIFSAYQIYSGIRMLEVSQKMKYLKKFEEYRDVKKNVKALEEVIGSGIELSQKDFDQKISELPKKPNVIIQDAIGLLEEFGECGDLDICPLDLVDDFVCPKAKKMYVFLYTDETKNPWGYPKTSSNSDELKVLVYDHCDWDEWVPFWFLNKFIR